MNKKLYSTFFSLILLLNTAAYAHTATVINQGSNKYKAVKLSPKIYNNSNSDVSDLLIYDEQNEAVPYFINSYTQSESTNNIRYDMKLVNSFVKDNYFYFDYALSKSYNYDIDATSIIIETKDVDFAKKVDLFGGYDNKNWEKIKEDIVYNVNDISKLKILFNGPQKYTCYRFKIYDSAQKISFSKVTLEFSETVLSKEYFKETVKSDFTVTEKEKQTIISIKGFKNVKIDKIALDTEGNFKRYAILDGAKRKQIYNLDFNNTVYSDVFIDADGYVSQNDDLNIIIDNKDDKPIAIKGVTVSYYVDELVFESKKQGNYTIHFGENKNSSPPVYDILNYKDMILKENIDKLGIDNIIIDEQKKEENTYDYKMIFNIVIVFIALLLGLLIITKLKKNK